MTTRVLIEGQMVKRPCSPWSILIGGAGLVRPPAADRMSTTRDDLDTRYAWRLIVVSAAGIRRPLYLARHHLFLGSDRQRAGDFPGLDPCTFR